jgi:threonine dehydrogenase-like Zn-dependent dehydrogenase
MLATMWHGPRDIRVEEVPKPRILHPEDALVRVVATCICGSDLWPYRGVWQTDSARRIGHEMVGVVEETGSAVRTVAPGSFVITPFSISDFSCVHCRNGVTTSCVQGSFWGDPDVHGLPVDGCQGQFVRVPLADGTLVAVPDMPDPVLVPGLLTLSDVMATGHHAATAARVRPRDTVVVVGDGAVGLCAVVAAVRYGAERVISMSRHLDRQALARTLGATDVVAERGDDGIAAVKELLGGIGADASLECVGTKQSMAQALGCTRPGGRVGFVGVPAGGPELPMDELFATNIQVAGGLAPVRAYLPDLLPDVLERRIDPGVVFDVELPLEQVAEGYAAMDERRAIKVLLKP